MKNIKKQKGITLVALIITIVVLLILAVVTVSSIKNDGIIEKAENSAIRYKGEQVKENSTLDSYLQYLERDVCPVHGSEHIFDQEVISQEYEHNSVTNCRVKASCYLSCECGESSNDWQQIFYYGNYGNHRFDRGTCLECGYYQSHGWPTS